MTDCKKPYTILNADEIDIDDLSSPVDYYFGMREIDGELSPVRVPGEKVTPTGSMQNVIALETNNSSLEVPENQVLAGYIDVQPGGNIMRLADATHPAQFLMLGEYTSGKMLVQSTGFLRIPGGHSYICSQQYYTSDNGLPTTDSASGQKLFIPLDDYTLMVNGDF